MQDPVPASPNPTSLDSPADEQAFRRAWERESLRRERGHTYIAIAVTMVLVPAWIPFDYILAPDWLYPFAVLRLLDVAIGAALLLAVRLTFDLDNLRSYGLLKMLSTGLVVAAMLPVLDSHYFAYVFGFSLIFWGSGIVFIWPVRLSVLACLALLVAHVALHLTSYEQIEVTDFIGATFYLASAAVVATSMVFMRRRL